MSYREILTGIIDKELNRFKGNDSGNAPVLLMLGGFKFSINTAVFQEIQRETEYRWRAQGRAGQWDAWQYVGQGDDAIKLPGVIYPDWNGGAGQLDTLRGIAAQGKPLKLFAADASGCNILGMWFIEHVSEVASHFRGPGAPLKQEFVISIRRFDD